MLAPARGHTSRCLARVRESPASSAARDARRRIRIRVDASSWCSGARPRGRRPRSGVRLDVIAVARARFEGTPGSGRARATNSPGRRRDERTGQRCLRAAPDRVAQGQDSGVITSRDEALRSSGSPQQCCGLRRDDRPGLACPSVRLSCYATTSTVGNRRGSLHAGERREVHGVLKQTRIAAESQEPRGGLFAHNEDPQWGAYVHLARKPRKECP